MTTQALLKQQFSDVFNLYASEGIAWFSQQDPAAAPVFSHVCFKFSSFEAYADYVKAAQELGRVTQEEFNGKQITWCRLTEPLKKGDLTLEWLELVEPRTEKNAFDGVANIGYCVPGLADAVKQSSADKKMMFRYQANHAEKMAPK
ncbi:MAG: VOC family protein [Alphaproteobacteria bacterium]